MFRFAVVSCCWSLLSAFSRTRRDLTSPLSNGGLSLAVGRRTNEAAVEAFKASVCSMESQETTLGNIDFSHFVILCHQVIDFMKVIPFAFRYIGDLTVMKLIQKFRRYFKTGFFMI